MARGIVWAPGEPLPPNHRRLTGAVHADCTGARGSGVGRLPQPAAAPVSCTPPRPAYASHSLAGTMHRAYHCGLQCCAHLSPSQWGRGKR